MNHLITVPCRLLISVLLAQLPLLHADTGEQTESQTLDKVIFDKSRSRTEQQHDWSVELGSGILFSNIRDSDISSQTVVPVQLTFSLAIDEVSLDEQLGGILRGYTEFLFRGTGGAFVQGQENGFIGAEFGPRYNFVQPGWKLVPFVEGTVGFLFADSDPVRESNGNQRGLGQDFNFVWSVSIGARYDINDDWFVRAAATFTHISNAGLSEPEHDNEAFDGLGPQLSVGYRF